MIRYLRTSSGFIGLLALLATAALFMGHDAQAQVNHFFPCSNTQLSTTAANSPVDVTVTFGLGLNDACEPFIAAGNTFQYNSGGLVYFIPPAFKVAKDADIPDGTQVGQFGSKAVLGLLENTCTTVLTVPFTLFEATTNRSNTIDAKAPGEPNRLSTMGDGDRDGVPDSAVKWPSYLDAVAQKAGMDLSKVVSRFVGVNTTSVSGTAVVLNFLVFEPGAKISKLINLDPRLGYPAVTILQDPSAPASNKDPVNDFCAPLWTTSILKGTVGSSTFRQTPGDGVYDFVTYVVSAPDEDGDGIENTLDPCPITPNNSGWDPRGHKVQNPGDQDGDGLPDDCDPFPTEGSTHTGGVGIANSDEDDDKWANRNDNCPIINNVDQADADSDGLGDACDPHVNERSPVVWKCLVTPVTIGSGGATPADPQAMTPCDPNAAIPSTATNTPGPTNTFIPGTTTRPTNTPVPGGSGVNNGPVSGIGTLAPSGTSVPAWAIMLAAFGTLGLFFGFGVMGTHIWRRR
jgi:hypothetical protein